jgi:hypothetical protein
MVPTSEFDDAGGFMVGDLGSDMRHATCTTYLAFFGLLYDICTTFLAR